MMTEQDHMEERLQRALTCTQVKAVLSSDCISARSYVRITNGSARAASADIAVYAPPIGALLGEFATATIPAYATLQLSASDIERGAGIECRPTEYVLVIKHPEPSYVQHIKTDPNKLWSDFRSVDISASTVGPAAGAPNTHGEQT